MSVFPDWARDRLFTKTDQVSSGLNLVLELKDPVSLHLPRVLWDIVLAQGQIKRALEGLSFVHFARFIPSWDGRALMVTTEFDGPLDPYVLDFVIALGDVFDTLLSYVKTPPPLPVREHPDEFVDWVRKWNRVPFAERKELTLFPETLRYPLYSAYPYKTVIDIAGARRLPPPAVDHPAAPVDLSDVQGNTLRGYRAKHGRYLHFRVSDAGVARRWLAKELTHVGKPWLGIASTEPWGANPPVALTQVAFTFGGLKKLLAPARQQELAHFPIAFREGAAERAEANFDRGDSAPAHWTFGAAADPVDVVIFVYSMDDPAPAAYLAAVKALETAAGSGLAHLRTLEGYWNEGKEWFEFTDGISDPAISGQCPGREPRLQPSASPGEFLLHQNYVNIYGGRSRGEMPQGLVGNGCFGVLRLMEQDIDMFKQTVADQAKALDIDAELLAAKLVGRWKGGAPLSLWPDHDPDKTQGAKPGDFSTNAFDYAPSWEFRNVAPDHEGLRCPVGAHIRRANPRTARVAGQAHSRRLLRRGLPSTWVDPSGRTRFGLMGLFLGSSIEHQFEFIQREWLHGSTAASGIRGTTDAIAGIRTGTTDFPFPMQDPEHPECPARQLVAKIPPLVQTRGCLYLFFPGLAALKNLDAAASLPEPVEVSLDVADAIDLAETGGGGLAQNTAEALSRGEDLAEHLVSKVVHKAEALKEQVKHMIHKAADVAPQVAAHLPGLELAPFLNRAPELSALLDIPALQGLADHNWKDLVAALIRSKLDSTWFQELIEAFAPPHEDVTAPPGVPIADLDLSDPVLRANPFDALKRLRLANQRMVWVPAQQACWVLNHDDCTDLFARPAHFVQSSPPKAPLPGGVDRPSGIVTLDPPRHTVVRAAFMDAFTAALATLTGKDAQGKSAIDRIVEEVVGNLAAEVRLLQFDYMDQFAHPVARRVIWRFIGIDDAEEQAACDALADRLVQHYGKTALKSNGQAMVAADAGVRLAAHLAKWLVQAYAVSAVKDNKFKGTLLGELAARTKPGFPIPHARNLAFVETLLTLVQTVLASQSPHFLLGSAGLHLMTPDPRPGKGGVTPWQTLAALSGDKAAFDQALALALDETRRFEPPLALVERYANGAQTISGMAVPAGCAVFAMVASANRDEAKFGLDAEAFHADRSPTSKHLSLGGGIHKCAGEALQALLVPTALGALIKAMPGLRLSNPAAQPAWHATIYFRVLQALSVTRCPPPPPVSVAARVHGDPQVPIS